jgi:delta-1-pyrroline-5-carboxylate synthetase
MSSNNNNTELPSRAALRRARRVCIKSGTSVVANENGRPSLTRLGAMAEQIAELVDAGVEVVWVSSGAVGMGKRLLRKQARLAMSFKQATRGDALLGMQSEEPLLLPEEQEAPTLLKGMRNDRSFVSLLDSDQLPHTSEQKKKHYDSACAAAGQYIMMNLYESLFGQCEVAASQLLVTQQDFVDPSRLQNTKYTIERLLSLGIVPIINENDAVSGNLGYTPDDVFSDVSFYFMVSK